MPVAVKPLAVSLLFVAIVCCGVDAQSPTAPPRPTSARGPSNDSGSSGGDHDTVTPMAAPTRSSNTAVYVGAAAAVVIALLLGVIAACCRYHRSSSKKDQHGNMDASTHQPVPNDSIGSDDRVPAIVNGRDRELRGREHDRHHHRRSSDNHSPQVLHPQPAVTYDVLQPATAAAPSQRSPSAPSASGATGPSEPIREPETALERIRRERWEAEEREREQQQRLERQPWYAPAQMQPQHLDFAPAYHHDPHTAFSPQHPSAVPASSYGMPVAYSHAHLHNAHPAAWYGATTPDAHSASVYPHPPYGGQQPPLVHPRTPYIDPAQQRPAHQRLPERSALV